MSRQEEPDWFSGLCASPGLETAAAGKLEPGGRASKAGKRAFVCSFGITEDTVIYR